MGEACSKNVLNRKWVPNFRKLERKKLCGRSRHRWKDSAAMDHKEMGYKNVNWTHLAQVTVQRKILVYIVIFRSHKKQKFFD